MIRLFFTAITILSLSQTVFASCYNSKIIFQDNKAQCEVTFKIVDRKHLYTHDIFITSFYDSLRIKENTCRQFCKNYQYTLAKLNHEPNSNLVQFNNASITDNTPEFGFINNSVDITDGIGAFEDLIKLGYLRSGYQNIDVGGGKFNESSAYLKEFNIINYVYDPYERDAMHNKNVLQKFSYDSATSISVLNVIPNKSKRNTHIKRMYDHLKRGGIALFKIYEGDRSGKQKKFQNNYMTNCYVNEIKKVFGADNVKLQAQQKLIIATKRNFGILNDREK